MGDNIIIMSRKPASKMIMTAKTLATYLKVHPLTVMRYAREGKIPAFKIGEEWRFHRKYIDRWLKSRLTDNLQTKDRKKLLL